MRKHLHDPPTGAKGKFCYVSFAAAAAAGIKSQDNAGAYHLGTTSK